MKIAFISILLILSMSADYSAMSGEYSWNKIPYPSSAADSNTLYSIHAFDRNEAVAVGSRGTIVHVNIEQGLYSIMNYGSSTFQWVRFADSTHGWAVGDEGTIYATFDKGKSWTNQSSGVKSRLNAVSAVDRNSAWIAGDSGIILYTSDGGENWRKQEYEIPDSLSGTKPDDCLDFVSVAFKNSAVGIIGGNWRLAKSPVILMSCDSGVNWTVLEFSGNEKALYDIDFYNEKPVVFMFSTTNVSEVKQPGNTSLPCFTQFQTFTKTGNFIKNYGGSYCSYHKIVNYNPYSYYNPQYFAGISNRTIYGIDSLDSQSAWISGTNCSIYLTVDSGVSWISAQESNKCGTDNLEFVSFSNQQHGIIGGENGTLLFSNDSGITWQFAFPYLNASLDFKNSCFIDPLQGFLLTQNKSCTNMSILLFTDNGGEKWTIIDTASYYIDFLRSVNNQSILCFNNFSINGITLISPGDKSVQHQPITTDLNLFDLFPVTSDTFFTTGSSTYGLYSTTEGMIFKSTDRGMTFDRVSSVDHNDARNKYFRSITFSDSATGWVVGDSGIILKSIDSGYTWQRQPSLTTDTLTKIRFCNHYFGWASGGSKIFLTGDGGETWQDKSILTSTKVSDVFCSDPQNCWAVGDDGLILHLSNKVDKYINIISPDINTILMVGDSCLVRWKGAGITQVSIAVSYDNGEHYTIYRAATDNDGEETIRISANATPSTSCKVRIRDLDGTLQSESELFTIKDNGASVNRTNKDLFENAFRIIGTSISCVCAADVPVSIKIYTIAGRQVYSQSITQNKRDMVVNIPLVQLPKGCYLIRLCYGKQIIIKRIVLHK